VSKELVTPATNPALTTAEAKAHLRVDSSDEDTLIDSLVAAATRHLLRTHGLVLTSEIWDFTPTDLEGYELDGFSSGTEDIRVPLHPLQSVTSVTYVDEDGDSQTFDAANYIVVPGAVPGRIRLGYDKEWPDARSQPNAVVVRAVFGYGDEGTDVPENLRHAIRLLIGHWFENRESVVVGATPKALEQSVGMLIRDEALLGVI
jgi:uncharacterized phiE125 gp8 family phage protein